MFALLHSPVRNGERQRKRAANTTTNKQQQPRLKYNLFEGNPRSSLQYIVGVFSRHSISVVVVSALKLLVGGFKIALALDDDDDTDTLVDCAAVVAVATSAVCARGAIEQCWRVVTTLTTNL